MTFTEVRFIVLVKFISMSKVQQWIIRGASRIKKSLKVCAMSESVVQLPATAV